MGHRILIVDDMHPAFMRGLEEKGFEFDYYPEIQRDEIIQNLRNYHVLVVRSKIFIDREILDAAPQLFLIARAGSGMDNIDEQETAKRNVRCINAPEANSDAVAELTAGAIIAMTRNIIRANGEVKNFLWQREENRGDELTEMTLGIIGFGHCGQALARKMSGFGIRILYYDKFVKNIPTLHAIESLMEEVCEQADIVSFHIPLTEENRGIIDKRLISSFNKPVYLLNFSRGGIMRTEDILWGLESGRLKGLALDVLENEKLHQMNDRERDLFHRLVQNDRVLLTPHIAGWTFSSYRKISEVLLFKLLLELSQD